MPVASDGESGSLSTTPLEPHDEEPVQTGHIVSPPSTEETQEVPQRVANDDTVDALTNAVTGLTLDVSSADPPHVPPSSLLQAPHPLPVNETAATRLLWYTERQKATRTDYKTAIVREPTLKDACWYCHLHSIPANQMGTLIEHYICATTTYTPNSSSACIGDATKDGEHYEFKVSLGGKTFNKFNYVQIRLNHNVHYYLLIALHLSTANVMHSSTHDGDLYLFKVPHKAMVALLRVYGQYAHGTVAKYGPVKDSLNVDPATNEHEFALRPTYGSACWLALMPHRVTEL